MTLLELGLDLLDRLQPHTDDDEDRGCRRTGKFWLAPTSTSAMSGMSEISAR